MVTSAWGKTCASRGSSEGLHRFCAVAWQRGLHTSPPLFSRDENKCPSPRHHERTVEQETSGGSRRCASHRCAKVRCRQETHHHSGRWSLCALSLSLSLFLSLSPSLTLSLVGGWLQRHLSPMQLHLLPRARFQQNGVSHRETLGTIQSTRLNAN